MTRHVSRGVLAIVALAGCAVEESDVGTSRHELHEPIDRDQWKTSHNTYEPLNTPSGKDITWHYTASTGNPPNPAAMMHVEIDLKDWVYQGLPSGWEDEPTLPGNWWIAHESDGPVTRHCGTVGRFTDCLNFIKTYHNNNPSHPFITVWVDKKDNWESLANVSSVRSPWQFDQLIAARFSASTLYTPSDVLADGSGTDMRQIILNDGWRTGTELQGKVMFILASDTTAAGNERLERYVEERGSAARAFIASYGFSEQQVTFIPTGFTSATVDWVAIYSFEWTSSSTPGEGECNSDNCSWLYKATTRHFLTRTHDLDDSDEFREALEAGATFRPVDCPHLSGEDRFDCGD
jgi:hypothetical protein